MSEHTCCLSFILVFLGVFDMTAQNPEPHFLNYTTEDGLPSNEVYHAIQDSKGFIWFGTDNGVSRYDGYGFENFGLADGLTDNVVFNLHEDSKGRIWMNTMPGILCYFEAGSFHLYEYNHLIRAAIDSATNHTWADGFIVLDSCIYIKLKGRGILKIDNRGSTKLFRGEYEYSYLIFQHGRDLLTVNTVGVSDEMVKISEQKYRTQNKLPPVEYYQNEHRNTLEYEFRVLPDSFHQNFTIQLKDGSLLFNVYGYTYNLKDNIVTDAWKNIALSGQPKAFLHEDDFICQGFEYKTGLHIYRSPEDFGRNSALVYLEGYSVSSIFKDNDNGFWVTTIDGGVFYCNDLEQKVYNTQIGLPEDKVMSVTFKNDTVLFIALWDGTVFELNTKTNRFVQLPDIPNKVFNGALLYDEQRKRLWASQVFLYTLENQEWKDLKSYSTKRNRFVNYPGSYKNCLSRDNDFMWTFGRSNFGKVDLQTNQPVFSSTDFGITHRTPALLESKSGKIWIGTHEGLFEFRHSVLISPDSNTVFRQRIEALEELSDTTIVIGIKGKGIYFWNQREKTPFLHLGKSDGLVSDLIENVHVDAKDQIWAGTPLGLNKITLNDTGIPSIHIFTTQHGLPSNEINIVRTRGDKVWVATSKGLTDLIERPASELSDSPMIQSIRINGEPHTTDSEVEIPYGNNTIAIEFLTINFRQGGENILYQFQLLPTENPQWIDTRSRVVNFSSLNNGHYTFKIRSQNEDGLWSEATAYQFMVQAPFWKKWWFVLGSIIFFAAVLFVIYKNRVAKIKQQATIRQKMTELERSALRAQMNPHFIFNALNSIQNYIVQGDKLSANRYLTRFARLIRSALNHSRVTKIPLENEIEMLTNYLELEQMRFKGDFEYKITVGDEVEPFAVEIPSMLIQPFIENAIIHGLSTKKSSGKIDIDFDQKGDKLLVSVTDNGIGINQSLKQKRQSLHKSVGMTITKQRLEILNGTSNDSFFKIEELKDESGKVLGTRVRLEVVV